MATGKSLRIVEEKRRARSVERRIRAGLIAYNAAKAGSPAYRALVLGARDARGRLIGGLMGDLYWNALYIHLLWLAAPARGAGLGTRLMQRAERLARRARKEIVVLSTYSFQAPGFYRRLGYRSIGRIANYPTGSTRYFLVKRLGRARARKK